MKVISACLLFLLSYSVFASSNDNEKGVFLEKYQEYSKYSSNGNWPEAAERARVLVELSEKLFGEKSKNTASLQYNYGVSLLRSDKRESYDEARSALRKAVVLYEEVYGEGSKSLIDPLMDYGRAINKIALDCDGRKQFSDAISIAKTNSLSEILVAELYQEAGVSCLNDSSYIKKAKSYLMMARERFINVFPEDDFRVAINSYYLGKANLSLLNLKEAEKYLLSSVEAFSGAKEAFKLYYQSSHAFLVEVYERKGEGEKADKHCQEVGRMSSWSSSHEAKPIFQTVPVYPERAWFFGREGNVVLNFYVDKSGFARDITVAEHKGSRDFIGSALKAVEKWRFVPEFKDGQPVDSGMTNFKFTFMMSKY